MTKDRVKALIERNAAATKAAAGSALWTNLLGEVITQLFSEQESITLPDVVAKLEVIAGDAQQAELLREAASEAIRRFKA